MKYVLFAVALAVMAFVPSAQAQEVFKQSDVITSAFSTPTLEDRENTAQSTITQKNQPSGQIFIPSVLYTFKYTRPLNAFVSTDVGIYKNATMFSVELAHYQNTNPDSKTVSRFDLDRRTRHITQTTGAFTSVYKPGEFGYESALAGMEIEVDNALGQAVAKLDIKKLNYIAYVIDKSKSKAVYAEYSYKREPNSSERYVLKIGVGASAAEIQDQRDFEFYRAAQSRGINLKTGTISVRSIGGETVYKIGDAGYSEQLNEMVASTKRALELAPKDTVEWIKFNLLDSKLNKFLAQIR